LSLGRGNGSRLARVTTAAECQNCGAALAGAYCSACGQKADVRIPSLGHLIADAVVDLTNFDSRIWRSLLTLVLKPGHLTRCYLEGQRARYAPPFRMYLVTSVAFFVVFSVVRLAGSPSGDPPTAESDAAAASLDASINAAVDAALRNAGVPPFEPNVPEVPAVPEAQAPAEQPGFNMTLEEDGRWNCDLGRNLDPEVQARLEAACRKMESDSGASFGRAFADNFPLMMLVFIPIVAAIMKVLYLFARRNYVEHLLFFLHVHTFFFLSALVWILVGRAADIVTWLEWPSLILGIAIWAYFPIYLYVAMRRVYTQGHGLTMLKYVVLGGSYFFAFLLTLLGLVVYTAITL
jgi:hypothetical protein